MIEYLIKYNKTSNQLNKILAKKKHLNVVYNVIYNKLNRKELNIIKTICDIPFLNELLAPLLINSQRIITITHTTNNHRYLGFVPSFVSQFDNSKLIVEIPINDKKKYIIVLSEQAYSNLEKLYFVSLFDGAVFYPIYYSKTFDYYHYQNVKNDDQLLGFYKPLKVNLPNPICWDCKYYSREPSFLGCAVNPNTNTKFCFDCRDYELTCDQDILSFYDDPLNAQEEYSEEYNNPPDYHYL